MFLITHLKQTISIIMRKSAQKVPEGESISIYSTLNQKASPPLLKGKTLHKSLLKKLKGQNEENHKTFLKKPENQQFV